MEPIKLGVDAGPLACGFWLGQDDDAGVTQVARYGSLPFNDREQAYSQAKRELYAIFRALKFFRHCYVMLFDLVIQHVKAKDNELADGLSRRPPQAGDDSVTDDEEWLTDRLEDLPSADGPGAEAGVNHMHAAVSSLYTEPVSLLAVLADGGEIDAMVVGEGGDLVKERVYTDEHQEILGFLTLGKKPSGLDDFNANKRFLKRVSKYFVAGGTLWRKGGVDEAGRLVVDGEEEQRRLLSVAHDEAGHKGVDSTTRALEKRYFWSTLWASVKEWVSSCDACHKRERVTNETLIRPTIPPGLFQRIGLDITFMPKALGRRFPVVVRDDLSSWIEARALKRKTARGAARFLDEDVFMRHGLPLQVTTDQGTEFKGVVDYLLKKYKIDITRTSAYNPRANGASWRSRAGSTGLLCGDNTDTRRFSYVMPLDLADPLLLERYQSIADADVEQALLVMIAERINKLEAHKLIVEMARKYKADARAQSSAHRNLQDALVEPAFTKGQRVLVRNLKAMESKESEVKLQDKWHGPYAVVSRGMNGGVWLQNLDGIMLPSPLHPTHVKPYRPRIKHLLLPEVATTSTVFVENP
ncbi:hypothetical protein A4X06_0g9064 [Tilletia controversa]|uniref:Integrase catalytic domain-containing protein n=1 Tax=Tilletia controversa TaxID=13291 RepID=A0A8X7SSG3_9BASI|nr:hypothetical protein A4X06_0g9064 [Tilletia controversa]